MPKKLRWRLWASVVAKTPLGEFDAYTEEEAIEMAVNNNGGMSVHHSDCHNPQIDEITAEQIDD